MPPYSKDSEVRKTSRIAVIHTPRIRIVGFDRACRVLKPRRLPEGYARLAQFCYAQNRARLAPPTLPKHGIAVLNADLEAGTRAATSFSTVDRSDVVTLPTHQSSTTRLRQGWRVWIPDCRRNCSSSSETPSVGPHFEGWRGNRYTHHPRYLGEV
ncbi:hypothetical protein [Mycobacterium lepromatosis]|uniref:hypothetical protein n=1 Tax=Mycobacterium lepromatosis TaxID=480418 RepID=UPI0012E03273|nr:hypothetical protein [Mycobacterium lepromatosis]